MPSRTDYFTRDSDNKITLTLKEDGAAIASSPTEIEIEASRFGAVDLTITRTPTGDGVTFSAGVLEITPRELTETAAIAALKAGTTYQVRIKVKTATETDGVVYGGNDSDNQLFFVVSDNV